MLPNNMNEVREQPCPRRTPPSFLPSSRRGTTFHSHARLVQAEVGGRQRAVFRRPPATEDAPLPHTDGPVQATQAGLRRPGCFPGLGLKHGQVGLVHAVALPPQAWRRARQQRQRLGITHTAIDRG